MHYQNIYYHNNKKTTSTKFSPNELRDVQDPNLIDIIIKNIIRSFKKHIINKNEIIDEGEKLLLLNTIIINNGIYIKNIKEKKSSFSLPCIFNQFINEDVIKVSFPSKINEIFNLKNEILLNIECGIIVPEFVFNYFTNKVKNELKKTEDDFFNQIENEENYDYMIYKNNEIFESNNFENIEVTKDNTKENNIDEKENDEVENMKSGKNNKRIKCPKKKKKNKKK